mmetsp:Transcript_17909/g.30472  ORF Transcript_17909/g.30472 Transcript_17909/m.30472 type:complete len:230 (-) Transcript_17909:637-1326(-)
MAQGGRVLRLDGRREAAARLVARGRGGAARPVRPGARPQLVRGTRLLARGRRAPDDAQPGAGGRHGHRRRPRARAGDREAQRRQRPERHPAPTPPARAAQVQQQPHPPRRRRARPLPRLERLPLPVPATARHRVVPPAKGQKRRPQVTHHARVPGLPAERRLSSAVRVPLLLPRHDRARGLRRVRGGHDARRLRLAAGRIAAAVEAGAGQGGGAGEGAHHRRHLAQGVV